MAVHYVYRVALNLPLTKIEEFLVVHQTTNIGPTDRTCPSKNKSCPGQPGKSNMDIRQRNRLTGH
jgi:hypothetical protein